MKYYFYNEGSRCVTCYKYLDFIRTLDLLLPRKIDVKKTIGKMCGFHIFFQDGTDKKFRGWYDLFPFLKNEMGMDLDLMRSSKSANRYSLYFNSKPTFNHEDAVEIDEGEDKKVEERESESDSFVVIDEEYVSSLYDENDKSGSKSALAKYASEYCGVDLNKNVKFEKMLENLREAIK